MLNLFYAQQKSILKIIYILFFLSSDYAASASEFLKNSVEKAAHDPFFNIMEPGQSAGRLAQSILENWDKGSERYAGNLSVIFLNILKDYNGTKSEREKLVSRFYETCIDENNFKNWNNFLCEISTGVNSNASKFVQQFILNDFFSQSIKFCFKEEENMLNPEDIIMTKEEENTLHYIAGFVVFSLKNKVKQSSPDREIILSVLEKWGSKEDVSFNENTSLSDYANAWTDTVNRGGLQIVSDDFYLFIKMIETIARTTLNLKTLTTYCGQNIRLILMRKFETNQSLQLYWSGLTKHLQNDEFSGKLLKSIYTKWINVRANSFVKSWLQIMKHRQLKTGGTISEQGEPALRKTLSKKKSLKSSEVLAKKKLQRAKQQRKK